MVDFQVPSEEEESPDIFPVCSTVDSRHTGPGSHLSPGGASVEPSNMKRGVLSLLSPLCLLVVPTTASPDGKYWWMGSGGAFGDSQDNQVRLRLRLRSRSPMIIIVRHFVFQINNNQYQQEGQGERDYIIVTPEPDSTVFFVLLTD